MDPFASGVLIIGTENDTKYLSEITKSKKSYQAELILGAKTNTLDPEGKIIDQKPIPKLNEKILLNILKTFEGCRSKCLLCFPLKNIKVLDFINWLEKILKLKELKLT